MPPAVLAAALVLVPLALPAAGQAPDDGLGMSPERFTVPAAQAGEAYLLTILLQNRRGVDDTIEVSLEGEAGAWASTDPPSGFAIAAGADREVTLRIEVPDGAGPGTRPGIARFTGQPGAAPSGSGASVRPSLGLLLNVTVGGEAVTRLSWVDARVEDAAQGQPVQAFVQVRNDGNVRTTAQAKGDVLPFTEDAPILSSAAGSLAVTPGETVEVPVQFAAGLAVGQYRARLGAADGSFSKTVEFKVTPPGVVPADGTLRLLDHVPTSKAGRPVRVDGWFENTGNVTIAGARLSVELRRDGALVEAVASEPRVVAAGAHVNLTLYVTPSAAGEYTLQGVVSYDGYQTEPRESLLSVTSGGGWSWWWLLIVVLAIAVGIGVWAWRSDRRRKGRGPQDGRR